MLHCSIQCVFVRVMSVYTNSQKVFVRMLSLLDRLLMFLGFTEIPKQELTEMVGFVSFLEKDLSNSKICFMIQNED
ncbi:MAG: hypothetical protein DRP91_07910 [Candidatus Neomarinimicrobiota bacterium]|nr:MAG: hypothetical protein DRP91_07910 [Candidatus Neomarinimicrobiota bacterium]